MNTPYVTLTLTVLDLHLSRGFGFKGLKAWKNTVRIFFIFFRRVSNIIWWMISQLIYCIVSKWKHCKCLTSHWPSKDDGETTPLLMASNAIEGRICPTSQKPHVCQIIVRACLRFYSSFPKHDNLRHFCFNGHFFRNFGSVFFCKHLKMFFREVAWFCCEILTECYQT